MKNPWLQLTTLPHHANPTDVENCQERWLRRTLQHNSNTAYGRHYHFDGLFNSTEYRNHVPVVCYEDLALWIQKIAEGSPDILFKGGAIAFERTGGSSGGSKLVPYSPDSLGDFKNAILPWLIDSIKTHQIVDGCAYWAISPATRRPGITRAGIPVGLPDAAYLGAEVLPFLAQLSAVPPWVGELTTIRDWQIATLYWLIRRDDLQLISIWSPTFLLSLIVAIDTLQHSLDKLLDTGGYIQDHLLAPDTIALSRLRLYLKTNETAILWPSLKLVSCWSDACSFPFFKELQQHLPQAHFQGKGLLATEGVVTVPNSEGQPTLAADSGFYEFFDEAGQSHLAHELSIDQHYEVVITTAGGLYRYRTGDLVCCTGFSQTLPILQFLGRKGLVSDLVGEKLNEAFVSDCLAPTQGFRMLIPCLSPTPRYVLILDHECKQTSTSLPATIEKRLERNPQYAYARKLGQLSTLEIVTSDQPLLRYQERALSQGARLGDIKAPSLARETDWLTTFTKEMP